MKVIFLDIDGVLNGHVFNKTSQSNGIDPACVERLNRIILSTDAKLVISSAWRYMILGGALTLKGFEYMLRTHGVAADGRVIGHTVSDELEPDRVDQIRRWLFENADRKVEKWIVLDDLDLPGMEYHIKTDGSAGLTEMDALRAEYALSSPEPFPPVIRT